MEITVWGIYNQATEKRKNAPDPRNTDYYFGNMDPDKNLSVDSLWKGRIDSCPEVLILAKTRRNLFRKIVKKGKWPR